jgi:hypothetical protein
MEAKQALEIIRALETIGKALDMEPSQVGSFVCFCDEKKISVINEAATIYNQFIDADIVTRGKMMGIEITEYKGGYMTETILSER